MVDLSNINQRPNAQDRITQNRDSILPNRRETRVEGVRVNADMRVAQRGEELANEIRRTFLDAGNVVKANYENDIAETAVKAEAEYVQGLADAAAGREKDPAAMQAYAYRRGFTQIEAANRQTTFERETAEEASEMLNRGANVAEIQAYYQERTNEFVGSTLDTYDTDEVRAQVGERLSRWGDAENNRIGTAVKEKTDDEFIELTVSEIQARLDRGETVDPITEIENLTATGLNRDVVRDAVVKGIGVHAMTTGDLSGIDALEDARDVDTDPAFQPGESVPGEEPAIDGAPLADAAPAMPDAPAAPAAPTVEKFAAPVQGDVSSGFGQRTAPLAGASTNHQAIDIAVPVGTPVGATASGVIESAGPSGRGSVSVIIRHADGSKTGFAHLSSVNVNVGDTVSQGQVVALSGNTGNSTGPHLHWTYRDANGNRADPQSIVGREIAGTGTPQAADAASSGTNASATEQEPAYRDRRPGRSLLTPEQQVYLAGVREQVASTTERRTEKARQDRRDALESDLYEASIGGVNVDDRITAGMRDGTLTAGEAMSWRNAMSSLRNDQLEGEVDQTTLINYQRRFTNERPDWNAISAQADRDYQAGRFGDGQAATRAYLEIKGRAISGRKGENAIPPEQRAVTGHARSYLNSALGGLGGGEQLPAPARRIVADAQIEFERRVATGEDPMTVADAVFATYRPRISNLPATLQPSPNASVLRQPGSTGVRGSGQELTYTPGRGIGGTE